LYDELNEDFFLGVKDGESVTLEITGFSKSAKSSVVEGFFLNDCDGVCMSGSEEFFPLEGVTAVGFNSGDGEDGESWIEEEEAQDEPFINTSERVGAPAGS